MSFIEVREVFSNFWEGDVSKAIDSTDVLIRELRSRVGFRVYNTRAHTEIYQLLQAQATNLCKGNYVNTQGVCCSTMVGAKGIGKTFAMKVFATVAPQLHSSLVTIYASLNNICAQGSPFNENSIMMVICLELQKLLPEIEIFDGKRSELGVQIVHLLAARKLHLFLLVDELDQLYKAHGDAARLAVKTLHELSYLGNQGSGHVAVVVCGSSSLMENLITTNATPQIKSEFPLLENGAINLNGTKFVTKRVYSTLPVDLASVASIAGVDYDDVHKPYLRAIAYLSGCSARKVDRVIRDGNDMNSQLGANSPENSLSGSDTLSNNEISQLRDKLYRKLYKKNRKLCDDLFKNPTKGADQQIQCVAWEDMLRPLLYSEVEAIWKKMVMRDTVSKENRGNLNYSILHLADRNWITVDGIVRSKPSAVFPFSMSTLASYVVDDVNHPKLSEKIYKIVSEGALAGGKLASNPRVLAAAVTVAPAVTGCVMC